MGCTAYLQHGQEYTIAFQGHVLVQEGSLAVLSKFLSQL